MANEPEKQAEMIFYEALEKEPARRESYLKEACGDNHELYQRVDALLQAYDSDDSLHRVPSENSQLAPTSSRHHENPGSVIGRYKLLEKIGEGGFGVVWAAEQKKPVKRRVALKIIKLGMDTKQVVARFEAERQALAMMDHPNIAKVLDAGSTDTGRPYFVMELVRGIPVIEYCDQEKLSIRERLDLFVKICHAIQHAHQKGIIHRDIKPSNILITLHDGDPVPRVIDFGIAKATQQELTEMTIYTQHHQFIGTPAYMSPEQAEMSGLDIDTRSDIYSLGVLLYELLTGRTPFDPKELMQSGIDVMRKIIREQEPPKPSTKFATLQMEEQSTTATRHATDSPKLLSLLRGDLDWIVMKCLEKKRTRRYDTANGLALDIVRHLSNEPVVARPPTVAYQLQKAWLRNKVVYTAACLVVASLLIGISLSIWQAWVATDAHEKADAARASESALREKAEESERKQRLIAYANDMSLAQKYLDENNLSKVDELLDRYEPQPGEEKEDVRGIYWYNLRGASEGEEIHTFPHETMVRSISLCADGTRLASNTMSGRVRLYNVNSPRPLREYGGGYMSGGAQDGSVTLSPDGLLLAADQQGTLKVWNAESGEVEFEQEHVAAPISFSPDSRSLAGATEEGLQIWNTADWKSRKLPGDALGAGASHFRALIFTPDSSRIIFSPTRFTSKLIVYSLATDTTEGELTGLDHPCVISTDGSFVAAGGWGGQVCVWDLASRKVLKQLKAHSSIVLGVALSPDGKTLVTGGNDSFIKVWDTKTYTVKRFLQGHHSQIWNLKFSSNGQYLASASMDQSVKLWARDSVDRPAQDSSGTDKLETKPVTPDTRVRTGKVASNEDTDRVPKTHTVMPDDSIQAAIDAAAPGDRIDIAGGVHRITDMIVVDRPLVIRGVASKEEKGPMPTVLTGASDLTFVIQVKTEVASPSVIEDLQIEAHASGIQHVSGALTLQHCGVTIRSALDFKSVISLEGMGADTVTIDDCVLRAEYAGDTPEGTPPDVDVVLVDSGPGSHSHYMKITITDSKIINDVPNSISNGIETRSTSAHMNVNSNDIRTQGIGIVMPNHVGAVDIRGNTIWSAGNGISVASDNQERSTITGNHITIDDRGLQVYPLFLKNYIANASPSVCISIGHSSAGVTAGFFLKEVIDRGTNFLVEHNVLAGNPKYGIAMIDSPEPENYGPPTPNTSYNNIITRNDFTGLNAERDIALGASTYDNQVFANIGVDFIFREAGDNDRNSLTQAGEPRYVLDEITSPSLAGNLLDDPATRPLWVWLPPSYDTSTEKRYPSIYLLHGFTGDHMSFKYHPMINVDCGAVATNLIAKGLIDEVIIVMPEASNVYGGSFYASNKVIGNYRSYIAQDLVKYIDGKYRTIPDPDKRSIAGNSMGANGALSLAMEYPKIFGAVAAMSPSADLAVPPSALDGFIKANPETLDKPTLVHSTEELSALLSGNVSVNVFYARGAAFSPNPDNPPFYVDLPLQYPEKTVVQDVWKKWLDQDMVSQIERDGQNLANTDIFIDIGIGPVTFMPEGHDIKHLLAALDKQDLAYTFVESPGDHLSHLRVRTMEVLKFLANPGAYARKKAKSEGNTN